MFMLPVCYAFIDKGIWYEWINESLHSKQLEIIGFWLAEFEGYAKWKNESAGWSHKPFQFLGVFLMQI
jgi:hypothetical protein